MPDYETLRANLERRGFDVTYFETAAQAADYLDRKLDGKTVGHGGALTLTEMGLPERLSSHAAVFSHWSGGTFQQAAAALAGVIVYFLAALLLRLKEALLVRDAAARILKRG